jgi:hypothetical protein
MFSLYTAKEKSLSFLHICKFWCFLFGIPSLLFEPRRVPLTKKSGTHWSTQLQVNKLTQRLTRIWEVPGSNLVRSPAILNQVFRECRQHLQVNPDLYLKIHNEHLFLTQHS